MKNSILALALVSTFAYSAEVNVSGLGKCVYSSVSGDANGNMTYQCQSATSSSPVTTPVQPTAGCQGVPAGWTVLDETTSPAYRFNSSSFTFVSSIPANSGVALKVTINKTAYPAGWKIADMVGGMKKYALSTCPGSMETYKAQKCGLNSYVRYDGYNNATNLKIQTTCFVPTSGTFYLNVFNPGSTPVGIQQANLGQIN